MEGDSIIEVGKGIQNDRTYNDGMATMRRTSMGNDEFKEFYGSNTRNVYITHGIGGTEGASSVTNVGAHGQLTNDNHVNLGDNYPEFSNVEGMSVKKGKVDIIEINTVQEHRLDKYDMAFALFHEMKAHLDNDKGSPDDQHSKFGNFSYSPGLSLNDAQGLPNFTEGSDAWKFLEQLLTTKIKDGNGTNQNKKDLEYMLKTDQKKPKKHEKDKSN